LRPGVVYTLTTMLKLAKCIINTRIAEDCRRHGNYHVSNPLSSLSVCAAFGAARARLLAAWTYGRLVRRRFKLAATHCRKSQCRSIANIRLGMAELTTTDFGL